MKGDDILERLLDFAARVGVVVDALPDTRLGRHIAGQLVRSGTSPAPNYSARRIGRSRACGITPAARPTRWSTRGRWTVPTTGSSG